MSKGFLASCVWEMLIWFVLCEDSHWPVVASGSLAAAGTYLTDCFPDLFDHRALS